MGRTGGHQRGDSVAAYGEVFTATVTRVLQLVRPKRSSGPALHCSSGYDCPAICSGAGLTPSDPSPRRRHLGVWLEGPAAGCSTGQCAVPALQECGDRPRRMLDVGCGLNRRTLRLNRHPVRTAPWRDRHPLDHRADQRPARIERQLIPVVHGDDYGGRVGVRLRFAEPVSRLVTQLSTSGACRSRPARSAVLPR